jgi:hypothetical protein
MAGMGPPPKPDDQRRRRNKPTFDWVQLPADGRAGEPPELPSYRDWSELVRVWWAEVWSTPQALQWQPSGVTLWPLAELLEQLARGETPTHTVINSIMPLWRDHGLSPAGLQQRRWTITPAVVESQREPRRLASVSRLAAPPAPKASAPKADWVEHAVALGMDRSDANGSSKAALIARFGPPKPKPEKAKAKQARPSDRLRS